MAKLGTMMTQVEGSDTADIMGLKDSLVKISVLAEIPFGDSEGLRGRAGALLRSRSL